MALRTVSEHRAAVLGLVAPRPGLKVPVGEALGLVLAEDVVARVDLPGFDNSAMDGYAVRSADVAGASVDAPVTLPVEGDIPAGDTVRRTLEPGTALRIMTGAPMPAGADTVVPVEHSDGGVGTVALDLAAEVGRHVRRRGEDIRVGDVVLSAGVRLGPGQIALIAASNVASVVAVPRPRVAVLSTGDELRPPGSDLDHGQIVDSNSLMLAALVRAAGAEVVTIASLPDRAEELRSFLAEVPGAPDLLLTTGGVSMGAYDTVKEVLIDSGDVEFVKVAMRPGMPQGCGVLSASGTPIITLPGNPVSSFVSFHAYVLPVLRRLAGEDPDDDGSFEARAAASWRTAPGKVEWTRVSESAQGVRPSGGQGSHVFGALAEATALAVVPADVDEVRIGDPVRCLPLVGEDRRHGR